MLRSGRLPLPKPQFGASCLGMNLLAYLPGPGTILFMTESLRGYRLDLPMLNERDVAMEDIIL